MIDPQDPTATHPAVPDRAVPVSPRPGPGQDPAGLIPAGEGRHAAPDAVWAEVRQAYLAGQSAAECCRRHGVGLTALRNRAAREGWRRLDQPWTPPHRLDPWDEGAALEASVGGDIEQIGPADLAFVAERRMMRAVLRGEAAEALRWGRVRQMMAAEDDELQRFLEADAAAVDQYRQQAARPPRADSVDSVDPADTVDSADSVDGVFGVRP